MEEVGIQAKLERKELVQFIHSLFPKKELINWEGDFEKTFIYNGKENVETNQTDTNFLGYALQIQTTESEFPTLITLHRTSEKNSEERELFLAIKLSQKFNCKTIIKAPNKLSKHPFLSLIIDQGKIYEADDCHTLWGDGVGSKVKIIREIQLKTPDFEDFS